MAGKNRQNQCYHQIMIDKLKKDIEDSFGKELTADQLWSLVKLCKHVRLRARNNAAFNNLFNNLFPHAKFKQVTKFKQDGSSYPGLSIEVDGQKVEQDED